MTAKPRQASRFRPGELGLIVSLGAVLFVNYAAMGITNIISVSGFLSQVKDQYILLVWAVDMVLLILAIGVQSRVVDRFNRVKLLPLAFRSTLFPKSVAYTLIYLLNDQRWRFFPGYLSSAGTQGAARVSYVTVDLSERDFNRLLESVVTEAQAMTDAYAGTLYLLEDAALRFVILGNSSLSLSMGGRTGSALTFPPVPLYQPDGAENHANVASHVALTGREIMIDDAYDTAAGFDFSGTKAFDSPSGYRSKSFFTMPLKGKDGNVIGVLQLINARHCETGKVVPFSPDESLWSLVLLATAALDAYIREAHLRAEIARLQIEVDDQCRASQVAQITDTRYFRELQDRAKELRSRHRDR